MLGEHGGGAGVSRIQQSPGRFHIKSIGQKLYSHIAAHSSVRPLISKSVLQKARR